MIKKPNNIVWLISVLFLVLTISSAAQSTKSEWFQLNNQELNDVLAISPNSIELQNNSVAEPNSTYFVNSTEINFKGYPTFAIGCCCGVPGYYYYMNKKEGGTKSEEASARAGCITNSILSTALLVGIVFSTYNSNF